MPYRSGLEQILEAAFAFVPVSCRKLVTLLAENSPVVPVLSIPLQEVVLNGWSNRKLLGVSLMLEPVPQSVRVW